MHKYSLYFTFPERFSGKNLVLNVLKTYLYAKFEKAMCDLIPGLSSLMKSVEERFGGRLKTSADFDLLSEDILQTTKVQLSLSTLKRIWGHVTEQPTPRMSTLDALSKYVGRKDFRDYCREVADLESEDSAFFSCVSVESKDLKAGAQLLIGWAPDRSVRLRYDGDGMFTVLLSESAKLRENDQFRAESFLLGHPLYISRIFRNGEFTPSYVAGVNNGLTHIEVVSAPDLAAGQDPAEVPVSAQAGV